jgi:hypothetical protein
VHIDPPDSVSVAVQRGMDHRLYLSVRLLAAFDVAVGSSRGRGRAI